MTDLHTLYLYRLQQAEETLKEAEKMLAENFTKDYIKDYTGNLQDEH